MADPKIIASYLVLLFFYVAHVLEEIWGRFWIMNEIFGPGWFIMANWLLFGIPLVFFYLIMTGRREGYILGMLYAAFMILNGIVHNVAVIVTGRYFDGFAGSVSGIGLILAGIPAAFYLRRGLPARR